MTDSLLTRGPDDSGIWADAAAGIALGQRRLSILDLSPAGHQPMESEGGRYVMVFNGEIYNHPTLRADLTREGRAPKWRGHSDTETLLAAFVAWGVEATLRRSIGMFAIALWDREQRTLTLVRDRLGEKPLYYALAGDTLLFASEPKAFRDYPGYSPSVDRGVLALYLRLGYVPGPYSIHQGGRKLPAGTLLTWHWDDASDPKPRAYWSVADAVARGAADPFRGSPEEAVQELASLLGDAVQAQTLSDVPVGAFLSGGVDSSAIVALMQSRSSRPVRTFTIGFRESRYDESPHAEAVARHLGTDHTTLMVTAAEAMEVVPRLPEIYCEPFADPSQIPTCLVSALARRHVTVALSGDGGDELFFGYSRYPGTLALIRKLARIPGPMRALAGRLLGSPVGSAVAGACRGIDRLLPGSQPLGRRFGRLRSMDRVLLARTPAEQYRMVVSNWLDPESVVPGATEPRILLSTPEQWPQTRSFAESMMAVDALTYLCDDILVKVDRAAMAVSLEGRVPMLDHRVLELAWRLPMEVKHRGGVTKWILREVLYRHVPRQLIERPKMGFRVPIAEWLKGPLRPWAEDLLSEERLRRDGFFDVKRIRQRWAEHLSGTGAWHNHLWCVLMFNAWLARASTR